MTQSPVWDTKDRQRRMAYVGMQDGGIQPKFTGEGRGGHGIALWICAHIETKMQCQLILVQTLPCSVLEAGVSGINKTLSLFHRAPIQGGGPVVCKPFRGSLLRGSEEGLKEGGR